MNLLILILLLWPLSLLDPILSPFAIITVQTAVDILWCSVIRDPTYPGPQLLELNPASNLYGNHPLKNLQDCFHYTELPFAAYLSWKSNYIIIMMYSKPIFFTTIWLCIWRSYSPATERKKKGTFIYIKVKIVSQVFKNYFLDWYNFYMKTRTENT